jgi:hypothetical protein
MNHHYASCDCVDGRLGKIDAERKQIASRLKELDAMERDLLGLVAEIELAK